MVNGESGLRGKTPTASGVECKTVHRATGSSEDNRRKLAITEGAHRAQPGARDF